MPRLPFCPLPLLFIRSLQNLQGFNQPDPASALLLLGSSHGRKATHEALPMSMPDLGLKGGHKPTPTIEVDVRVDSN